MVLNVHIFAYCIDRYLKKHDICPYWQRLYDTSGSVVPRASTATGQRSFAVKGPAIWNRLPPALQSPDQAGTEDAPVLDRPAPLRRLRDSGASRLI